MLDMIETQKGKHNENDNSERHNQKKRHPLTHGNMYLRSVKC